MFILFYFLDKFDNCRGIGKTCFQLLVVDDDKFWLEVEKRIYKPLKSGGTSLCWCLSKGARKQTQTLEEFERAGAEYFNRNFVGSYVCFPPCHLIEDEDIKRLAEFFEKILKTFLFKRVILIGPNIAHHAQLVSGTKPKKRKNRKHQERSMMVVIGGMSLILVVRIASNEEDIKTQLANCQQDVLHFTQIHGHNLKNTKQSINLCTIIACPSVEREKLEALFLPFQFSDRHENLHKMLFICKGDVRSADDFTRWWRECLVEFKKQLEIPDEPTNNTFLSDLIGQHMVSMATIQEGLPTLSSNLMDQLNTVILTAEQFYCVKSSNKKKLIKGPFGSGKTLMGQAAMRELIEATKSLGILSTIFYISCDQHSLVDRHVEKYTQTFSDDNVKIVCGSLHQLYREYVGKYFESVSASSLHNLTFFHRGLFMSWGSYLMIFLG